MPSLIRFVRPETITLPLSRGDSITIRRRLSSGERREMFSRMYRDQSVVVDPMRVHMAVLTAYLLDWSFVDEEGRKVPIADLARDHLENILNDLDPESFAEIYAAIDAHVETDDALRSAEKNVQDGAIAS
jgi:hypothetical protein